MIELLVTDIDGDRLYLDVDQGAPIALDKTFLELTDFVKRKGDFSRSFDLPRTPTNDRFFGQFGNPSAIGGQWNPLVVSDCWLLQDTNILIEGTLKLESTGPSHNRYSVSISGQTFTLKDALGDKSLSDLDMTAWAYQATQIPTSWNRSLWGGHVVFPIHDFGFGYGLYKKKNTANAIIDITDATCADTAKTDRTLPAFRLNELLRMIFSEVGFDLSGSWFSETSVEDIYVQSDNPLSSFFQVSASTFNANPQYSWTIPTGGAVGKIPFVANPAVADFDNANNQYIAPVAGTYTFSWFIQPVAGSPSTQFVQTKLIKNGVTVIWLGTPFAWSAGQGSTQSFVLAATDTVHIQFAEVGPPYSAFTGFIGANTFTYWRLTGIVPTTPGVDPSEHLANYKQVDFLREVVGIFNLIIWRDSETSFRLDTWDYYMATYGSKKDWTDKVDISAEPQVRPINDQLTNPINLELKQAQDILNEEYIRVTGRSYGAYREDTLIPFTQGPQAPYKVFAPAPLQEVISSVSGAENREIIIAKYYGSVDDITYKPPGLQLMYYCGMRSLLINFYYLRFTGDTCQMASSVPVFSPFLLSSGGGWNVDVSTLDLNFTWFTPPSANVTNPSEQNLYARYFAEMLRERYAEGNKIIEFRAFLTPADIAQFSFADSIMINLNGTPVTLKILEIKDFTPNGDDPAKIRAMITFMK